MNIRGNLWIIPDENQLNCPVYHEEIIKGLSHTDGIMEFIRKNKLPIPLSSIDSRSGPLKMAELGHMVVKTEDNSGMLIFYIPAKITQNQWDWFLDNRLMFGKYQYIGAFSYAAEWYQLHGLNEIKEDLRHKITHVQKGL